MKPAGRRWRPLAVLTVVVLALHLALLHEGLLRWQPEPERSPAVLRIRSVPPASPVPEPNRPAARAPRAQPAIEKVASVRPATPRPAPAPPEPLAAAPAPPPVASPPAAAPSPAPAPEAAAPAAIYVLPGSQRLRYQVLAQSRGLQVPGQAELLWRHDGASYEARLEISAPLLPRRQQRSTGRITALGLAPERFADRSRSEEAAHFDAAAGRITFSTNRPEAALQPGAQDRLSVLLQLSALVAGDPGRFGPGATLSLQTASTREAEAWTFVVDSEEELALPGGALRGLKLTRAPRKEFDQKVELWLAPGQDYAPVRLRLTQPNGDWLDLQWSATDRG